MHYDGHGAPGIKKITSRMNALTNSLGTVTSSGQVWAKHGEQPAGTDMSGVFSAQVNFDSPSVTDFDMNAAGGGHSASITNAQGSFTGSSSFFVLNTGTGSWQVDGAGASTKDARGALYGEKAQGMGVLWNAGESAGSSNGAWGICVGNR